MKSIFLDSNKNLKKDHKYYKQVQCLLFVFILKICEFVIWIPMQLHITEIERDDPFMMC